MNEIEQLRKLGRDLLSLASRIKLDKKSIRMEDALSTKLLKEWNELLSRARKLTKPENLAS